jgi:hypothetical protein
MGRNFEDYLKSFLSKICHNSFLCQYYGIKHGKKVALDFRNLVFLSAVNLGIVWLDWRLGRDGFHERFVMFPKNQMAITRRGNNEGNS